MASPNNIAQLPRIKPGRRGALAQIIELQRVLFEDARNPETTAASRAQVARAWDVLEERKRILRGRGLPKPVEAANTKPKRKPWEPRRPSFYEEPTEPTESNPIPAAVAAEEASYEMRDIPGFPGAQQMVRAGAVDTANPKPANTLAQTDAHHKASPPATARPMKVGDRIGYGTPPQGPRIRATVTRLPRYSGDAVEVRTDTGEALSFNPQYVSWEHC